MDQIKFNNNEFLKNKHLCFDKYVDDNFILKEKTIEQLKEERNNMEKIPFLQEIHYNNKLFNNYFESAKVFFVQKNYKIKNNGFSKNMWLCDFGKSFGTFNFANGIENIPKINFNRNICSMNSIDIQNKINEHYYNAKQYNIIINKETLRKPNYFLNI